MGLTRRQPTAKGLTRRQVVHSLPLYVTYGLGTVICWAFTPWVGLLYVAVTAGATWWFLRVICPNCAAYDGGCPSGYNLMSRRVAPRGDPMRYREAFRRNIWTVALSWFLPLIFGGLELYLRFDWLLAALFAVFIFMAFVVLPFGMRAEGCARCPQRKDCPYAA